jgi:hypothetical protein
VVLLNVNDATYRLAPDLEPERGLGPVYGRVRSHGWRLLSHHQHRSWRVCHDVDTTDAASVSIDGIGDASNRFSRRLLMASTTHVDATAPAVSDCIGHTGGFQRLDTPRHQWLRPAMIQGEHFDNGGPDVVPRPDCATAAVHRSTDVDLEATSDAGGGQRRLDRHRRMAALHVDASTTASHATARVANTAAGGLIHVEVDGRTSPACPNTGHRRV